MAEKVKDAVIDLEDVYNILFAQRDSAKSNTLKELLNQEIGEYIHLTEKIGKFMQLYLQKIKKGLQNSNAYLRDSIEDIKTIEDKQAALEMIRLTQRTYSTLENINGINIYIMNLSMESYIKAINRNFKDWGDFAKKLGEKISDTIIDEVPVISEIKNLCQNVKDIAELVNEFEDNATDYSEVDKKLFEIEEHILIMQLSKALTEESIEILEKL